MWPTHEPHLEPSCSGFASAGTPRHRLLLLLLCWNTAKAVMTTKLHWNTPHRLEAGPTGLFLVLERFWMLVSFELLEAGIMLDKPGNKLMSHHNRTICAVRSSSKHYNCPPLQHLGEMDWGLNNSGKSLLPWSRQVLTRLWKSYMYWCNTSSKVLVTFQLLHHIIHLMGFRCKHLLTVNAAFWDQRQRSRCNVGWLCAATSQGPVFNVSGQTGTLPFTDSFFTVNPAVWTIKGWHNPHVGVSSRTGKRIGVVMIMGMHDLTKQC